MYNNGNVKVNSRVLLDFSRGVLIMAGFYTSNNSNYLDEIERLTNLNKTILSTVKNGIYGVDVNGITTFVNDAACKKLGYEQEELIGKSAHEMFHHSHKDGSDYPIDNCPASIAIKEGKSQYVYDEVYWRKDGTSFPVEYHCAPIKHKDETVGAIVSFDNISDQKNLNELMIKSERNSLIGELAAGIAHEIGNPLTILKGFLQLFESGTIPKKEYINIMKDELDRIEEIASDILVLAKPDRLKFSEENIVEIIKHVVNLMSTDAFKKSIKIYINYINDKIIVNCIKNQIKQVFINLLKNAIEAMDKGDIVINVKEYDQYVEISVSDNGPGFEEEILKKIGEPFITTKENGTGLGIVVTKRIIENHNGTFTIDSVEGNGTTITIVLPINYIEKE